MASSNNSIQNSNYSTQFHPSSLLNATFDTLSILELFLSISSVPLSLFCAYLIGRTALLHQNLKSILIGQCLQILLFSLFRLYMLFCLSFLILYSPIAISFNFGLVMFANFVGHVLMIERILATIYVEKYENFKDGGKFTLIWLLITLGLSISNGYFYQIQNGQIKGGICNFIFYTQIVAMFGSFAEIFIISLVTHLNENQFALESAPQNVRPLTVRYQLAENIRTGRQLAPFFLFHFINVFLPFLMVTNLRFEFITDSVALLMITQFVFLIHSLNNFLLLATLIICHPFLYLRARMMLKRLKNMQIFIFQCSRNRINPSALTDHDHQSATSIPPLQMEMTTNPPPNFGHILKRQQKFVGRTYANEHFAQLRQSWGDKFTNMSTI